MLSVLGVRSWHYMTIEGELGYLLELRVPEFGIVGEFLQSFIVAGRLEQRKSPSHNRIHKDRGVFDI